VLAGQVARVMGRLRAMGLYKPPGVAETIDWAEALVALGRSSLDAATVEATLGTVLKYREDQQRVRSAGLDELLAAAR
jgi:MoxR-like ATPase